MTEGLTAQKTALVVDDNKMVCEFVCAVLKMRGYEVRVAHDGAEAVERFREQPCDLVVMDIDMPRMSGIEALRHLRALDQHVGVIIMTGGWADSERVEAAKMGAAFIDKPFSLDPFLHLIDQLEENRALRLAEHPCTTDDPHKNPGDGHDADSGVRDADSGVRDQRNYPRVRVHLPSAFMRPAERTADQRSCDILDISLGGSSNRFVLASPFPAGTEVHLCVASLGLAESATTHEEVTLAAVVVWTDFVSNRCGAQFRDLDERQRLALETVVVEGWRNGGYLGTQKSPLGLKESPLPATAGR